jgi:hypothetical protein
MSQEKFSPEKLQQAVEKLNLIKSKLEGLEQGKYTFPGGKDGRGAMVTVSESNLNVKFYSVDGYGVYTFEQVSFKILRVTDPESHAEIIRNYT